MYCHIELTTLLKCLRQTSKFGQVQYFSCLSSLRTCRSVHSMQCHFSAWLPYSKYVAFHILSNLIPFRGKCAQNKACNIWNTA